MPSKVNPLEIKKPGKNNVKATKKQRQTFAHMKNAKTLQEAMLKGGYSKKSAIAPTKNFLDREGTKTLIEEYKDDLINAGISLELLAEIQAEGLFDQNAAIRLGYLKETKKDFGVSSEQSSVELKQGEKSITFKVSRGE